MKTYIIGATKPRVLSWKDFAKIGGRKITDVLEIKKGYEYSKKILKLRTPRTVFLPLI